MKRMQQVINWTLTALLIVLFSPRVGLSYPTADSLQLPLYDYLSKKGANYFGRKDYVTPGKWHLGDDVSAKAGDRIYAIGAGIVRHAKYHAPYTDGNGVYHKNYGGMYIIEHNANGVKVCVLYVHMNIATFTKGEGQEVTKGEYLGQVGNQQQNGDYPEHFHSGIRKGGYPADPNALISGDWIFSGYTANEIVLSSWHNPTDFVMNNSAIGQTSYPFVTDPMSQAFVDAFNRHCPKIGWPVNYVHKWTSTFGYRVYLQDFQGDMDANAEHFGWNGQTALIYNNINEPLQPAKAYLVKEGMWDYYRNHNGPAALGEPFTEEVTLLYANSPLNLGSDPVSKGEEITVQKFNLVKDGYGGLPLYENQRRTLVYNNTRGGSVFPFAVGTFNIGNDICPQGEQIYVYVDNNPANDIAWPTENKKTPTGDWYTKSGDYIFLNHLANGQRGNWGLSEHISEGNHQFVGSTIIPPENPVPSQNYTVKRTTTCKDVEVDYPKDPIGEGTVFYNSDNLVCSWIELNNVYGVHAIKWRWYDPSGNLAREDSLNTDDPADQDYPYWDWYNAWGYLGIASQNSYGSWRVRIYIDNSLVAANTFTLAVVLTAPANLTVSPRNGPKVVLNWQVSAKAASYRIYRDEAFLAETAATTYTDTSVQNATTYRYKVLAVNAGYQSPFSETKVVELSQPQPPAGLRVIATP